MRVSFKWRGKTVLGRIVEIGYGYSVVIGKDGVRYHAHNSDLVPIDATKIEHAYENKFDAKAEWRKLTANDSFVLPIEHDHRRNLYIFNEFVEK